MAKKKGKTRGGKRPGAGRPPGRLNNRTLLLRAGLDQAIPDAVFFKKVKELIDAGDVQMIIQVGKWKGLTDRHELVGDSFPADGVFRSVLSSGEPALAPPARPAKGGGGRHAAG
jgi:hypothetical protein